MGDGIMYPYIFLKNVSYAYTQMLERFTTKDYDL